VQHSSDKYFVRLGAVPTATQPALVDRSRHAYDAGDEPVVRRRRHRHRHRRRFRKSFLLLVPLAVWCGWAAQRPGGISGTINGWIEKVQGDVVKISADPDLHKAASYYNGQYSAAGSYPQLTDDQLATAGIGIGVNVQWCSGHDIVLQGAVGGGWASRLLIDGRDVGTVNGRRGCPGNISDPKPWKL
jgi:hypothetical protein